MSESPAGPDNWFPVNEAIARTIPSGSKATYLFEPDASGLYADAVAASKYSGLTYEVVVDGETRYGPAAVPPTDVDDMTTTHNPRLEAKRHLRVIVRNPSGVERDVTAQIRGVEE